MVGLAILFHLVTVFPLVLVGYVLQIIVNFFVSLGEALKEQSPKCFLETYYNGLKSLVDNLSQESVAIGNLLDKADAGDPEAAFKLGMYCIDLGKTELADKYLRQAVVNGHKSAHHWIKESKQD
jgi:hypothetical protein